ncbi:MAG TPA: Gfo/Idh/MocA family oxidoreductase, partial [Thermogutta sp.]|nr:Gfo/Idh/MocA family oxidoreductase [Thermogutta sp.]
MKAKATRRQFLGVTGVVGGVLSGVPMLIPASALGLTAEPAPSERITLGVIGIGPRATYDLQAMLKLPDVRCLAIADVQASRREAGKKLVDEFYGNQDCVTYRDFRELLDRKDIDTVLVATGDRWHAPASIMAAEAGKDVYREKPCGITI